MGKLYRWNDKIIFVFILGYSTLFPLVFSMFHSSAESEIASSLPSGSSSVGVRNAMRKSKFFPYFLIQFPNEPCSSPSGSGVCVSTKDCRASGGTSIGVCAQGFGSCCRFVKSCGNGMNGDVQVRENSTELKSSSGSCRYVLPKARGICQVRLDFLQFTYGRGLSTGDCSTTKIVVEQTNGVEQNKMEFCGNMTGQHLYLNYGSTDKLYIISSAPDNTTDKYSIRVSYFRCDSRYSVPSHCSQYFTERQGEIKSFNFPQQQLNNQDYTICIADQTFPSARRGRQMNTGKRIQWKPCGSNMTNFLVSRRRSDAPIVNPNECTGDYVQIFGGNKYCGNSFSKQIESSPPYLLHVHFDDVEMREPESQLIVTSPGPGLCDTLRTKETTCVDDDAPGMCKCVRMLASIDDMDENNTGFCLQYKILN